MLEIFSDVRDAMQELKDLQIAHGDGDTLLGIVKPLVLPWSQSHKEPALLSRQ